MQKKIWKKDKKWIGKKGKDNKMLCSEEEEVEWGEEEVGLRKKKWRTRTRKPHNFIVAVIVAFGFQSGGLRLV